MKKMPDASLGAVVTDPPYGLNFMERGWDRFPPQQFQKWCEEWGSECLRVLKPGGYLVSFGGARTFHRLTCGLEDAGFDIRDVLMWLYGSGWPKNHDAGKVVDAFTLYGKSDSVALKRVNDEARRGPGRVRASTRHRGIMGEERGERIIRDEPWLSGKSGSSGGVKTLPGCLRTSSIVSGTRCSCCRRTHGTGCLRIIWRGRCLTPWRR
jgi:DNA methylase